ncbi:MULTISPECIES: ABC transporter ATP-binding protein [Inquilinus]|uniref:Oligopeptide/dipeptide ABC transporter ATP-binding protein n=1 Tax=Inquilinus ginsengisoli TaxID=363840 RepID=A0ABU1JXP2_9PROT|nr:ABC transporter ATP-binding protein [Inquilinus ginsengisoli]MDR6293386.1 oligopeptide/dipeptide ABC transporter ATP-binding protein [Inquilinus ginsengisoli]
MASDIGIAPTPMAATPDAAPAREVVLAVENFGLSLSGVSSGRNLVDGVSLSVARGETLCIVGESGCGKSITALGLMGLLPPVAQITSGTAMFEGRDLFRLTDRQRADIRGSRMAMIFQEPMTSLNPAFTIGNQIAEGIRRHRAMGKAEARSLALEMLRRVRIPAPEKRLDAYPHQLSGGMRQRAMIAMSLANDPQLLIADEPTTALDVTIQAQILALVRRLQDETGTAMILITHDLGVVAEVADQVAVMYAGRIVESGPVDAIFADPQHPYTIGLMGSVPSLGRRAGRLATIPGTVPPADRMPAGCRFAPRCPFAAPRCTAEAPPAQLVGPDHRAACWFAPLELHAGGPA